MSKCAGGAALAAAVVTAACSSGPSPGSPRSPGHIAGSCAGPQVGVGRFVEGGHPAARPLSVQRGQTVRMRGRFFLADCYDTGQSGHPPAIAEVRLVFVARDGRQVALSTVHPSGSLGRFATVVMIPADAAPGRGRIRADPAQPLAVVVVPGR